jgi:hypothetical protein
MSFAKGTGEKDGSWEKYLLTIISTFAAFFLGLVVAANAMQVIPDIDSGGWSALRFAVQLLPYLFSFGALLFAVKLFLGRTVLSVITSRKSFDWRRFFFAFGLWLTFQIVFLILANASGAYITFDLSLGNLLPLFLVSITLLPLQTAFEDVFYRGVLFQGFSRATGRAGLSVLAIAVLFGLMHAGNPEVKVLGNVALVYYIISGLFLGLLAHFDDGLELGMGYHFANNFYGAFIVTNTYQVFQTKAIFTDHSNPALGWELLLPLLVLQPLLLFAFYRIYRWKNPLKRLLE